MLNKLPNTLTLIGIILGLVAASVLIIHHNYLLAFLLILVSALIDRYDGKIARKHNVESTLGKYLDNTNDIISFSITPAIAITLTQPLSHISINIFLATLYLLASMLRLHSFSNATAPTHLKGLPTTIGALIILLSLLLLNRFNTDTQPYTIILTSITIVTSILLIQRKFIKKI